MQLSPEATTALITFIVGGGLAALITQSIKGFGSIRAGARSSTREVIKDLAAARDESEDRESVQRTDANFWRGIAGDYAFQLRSKGHAPVPAEPRAPSEQQRTPGASRRQRRADRAPSTQEIERVVDEEL
jgi:hypothetical protein